MHLFIFKFASNWIQFILFFKIHTVKLLLLTFPLWFILNLFWFKKTKVVISFIGDHMKKLIFFFLIIIPIKVMAINASSYIVMDGLSGRVLEGQNIYTKKLIASTTKIMTCIIALEDGNIDNQVIVDNDVLKAYGSAIYIEKGEQLKLIDLLYGLMLRSGNDAALEIANNVAGSMENFVNLMNSKAKDLGMNDTFFINDNGLEEKSGENYSTSYDMAILMRYALNNNVFKKIIGTKQYKIKTNYKTYEWTNKNRLLTEYKYTIGGKTGFTEKARRTLVTATKKDNKMLIVVTLNDPNDFADHKSLYEKNFEKYNLVKILDKNNFKLKVESFEGTPYIDSDYHVLLTKEEEKKINIEYNINTNNQLKSDNSIGKVQIKLNNELLETKNIYVKSNELKKDNWWHKFIDFIIFWN